MVKYMKIYVCNKSIYMQFNILSIIFQFATFEDEDAYEVEELEEAAYDDQVFILKKLL